MIIGKNVIGSVSIILSLIFMSSCQKEIVDPVKKYSFFVAGHTYGQPGVDNVGLHPPFQQKFEFLNNRNASLGFLTGDIVKECTEKNWNEVDSVLAFLDADVYLVAGNHDVSDRELFEARYGRTYYYFKKYDDLFIILDPNFDHWNISGLQLEFLQKILSEENQVRNIFVFFHQILWWSENNKYRNVRINSKEGRADTINFWSEIIPLFNKLDNPVSMFAGDMGAVSWSDNYMYDTIQNITFIASGMGDEDDDNIVIVNVSIEGIIDYDLIAINGDDINALGELEDYILPTKYPVSIGKIFQGD